jgi:hypothetical protein
MPIRLDTVLTKVEQMPNRVNSGLLKEFYQHMKDNGTSQNYQKGNLKAMIHFAEHIGAATSFFDIDHKQILFNQPTYLCVKKYLFSHQIDLSCRILLFPPRTRMKSIPS